MPKKLLYCECTLPGELMVLRLNAGGNKCFECPECGAKVSLRRVEE